MILAILMVLGAGIFSIGRALSSNGGISHPWPLWRLLGGMYLGRRYALWVPLAVLAVTDIVLNV